MQYQKHCPGCFKRKDGLAVCEACGYDESTPRSPIYLPYGTILCGQYRVGRVLGKPGGFGITYLGWDVNLQQRVAIKEFLPPDMAARVPASLHITVHTQDQRRGFDTGKDYFLREARTVAQLDHPNIVRVRNFFNANDTAYMVMDYYDGMTLDDYLTTVRPTLDPSVAVSVVRPILDGLRYVHQQQLVHRDIKPHNLYLAAVGRPILLDFGAARQAIGGGGKSMSVVLTEGYAPLEQYQRRGTQGPWTDVYGVATTLYRAITGESPPFALDRLQKDPLVENNFAGIPDALKPIMAKAMAVHAENRYQSAQEFMDALDEYKAGLGGPAPEPIRPPPQPVPPAEASAPPVELAPALAPVPAPAPVPLIAVAPPEEPMTVEPLSKIKIRNMAKAERAMEPRPDPPPALRPRPPDPPSAESGSPLTQVLPWAGLIVALLLLWFVFFYQPDAYTPSGSAPVVKSKPSPAGATQALPQGAPAELSAAPRPLSAAQRSLLPGVVGIPGGSLSLGAGADSKAYAVTGLRVMPSEVNVAQFRLFVEHSSYRNPNWASYPCEGGGSSVSREGWDSPGYRQTEDHPVVCVSWRDARAYVTWLNDQTGKFWRLPTEAEWEYASRAGSKTKFWWGNDFKPGMAACTDCPPRIPGKPALTGSGKSNAFGLSETADNVREWTCSLYEPFTSGAAGKCGSSPGDARITVRGGSWKDNAQALASSSRSYLEPDRRNAWTGFRLVQE